MPAGLLNEATLSAYNPSWRDKLATWIMGNQKASPEKRHFVGGLLGSTGLGSTGASVSDFTPVGGILGAQEAAQRGDMKGMALAALPMPAKAASGVLNAVRSGSHEMVAGISDAAKMANMPTNDEIANEIRQYFNNLLNEDPYSFHGLRITEHPLTVGEKAPPSKQWYADFISEDHPTFGREAFPDHGSDLSGPSVIGISNADDIERALQLAKLIQSDSFEYYPGNHVSAITGPSREYGSDIGEWILPDSVVSRAWLKEK